MTTHVLNKPVLPAVVVASVVGSESLLQVFVQLLQLEVDQPAPAAAVEEAVQQVHRSQQANPGWQLE